MAEVLGIGRGSDLVLYVSVMTLFAMIIHLYLTVRRQSAELTRLTRHVAQIEAQRPAPVEDEKEAEEVPPARS